MENCDAVLAVCLKIVFFLTKMTIFWVYNPFLDTDTHTHRYIYIQVSIGMQSRPRHRDSRGLREKKNIYDIFMYVCVLLYIVVCIYIYVGGGTISMKTAEHLS